MGARARAHAGVRRRARATAIWRGDGARLHRDGHEIPVSQVIVAHTGPDGEVDFYATIARDMTRERAAEAALRASEERFRIAFQQAPVGMALTDLDGRYVQVNDAYCRTVRRTREELIGATPMDITHPEDAATPSTRCCGCSRGESEEYSFEKRYITPGRRHDLGGAHRRHLPRRRRARRSTSSAWSRASASAASRRRCSAA